MACPKCFFGTSQEFGELFECNKCREEHVATPR